MKTSIYNNSISLISAQFKDPQQENAYQQEHLKSERKQTTFFVILASVLIPLFIFTDYHFLGGTPQFKQLLLLRALFFALSLGYLFCVNASYLKKILPIATLIWNVIFCGYALYIAHTRPPAYNLHLLGDIIVIISLYIIIPNRLLLQIIPPLVLSTGVIIMSFTHNDLSPSALRITLVSVFLANINGYLMTRRAHLGKRIQHYQLAKEKELSTKLQEEIKKSQTLTGLIPICAGCKRIRDDKGYWQQVESYVSAHSTADFTHGICPECTQRLYPEQKQHQHEAEHV